MKACPPRSPLALLFTALACVSIAQFRIAGASDEVEYSRQIRPILERHCLRCHGPDKQESGFRLDVRATALRGGDFGEPAIVPGDSGNSLLFQAVTGRHPDLVMPPEGPRLAPDQIDLLGRWIDQGALMPDSASEAAESELWSFQPLAEPRPLSPHDPWVRQPIDAFVLRQLRARELEPSPPADRVSLIRRVYLIMHGLPPTPAQVQAFVSDPRESAYDELVERVLASPRYGERWARHWLDVVRFGETHGFETNRERPGAWHYRDYVIDALNSDKPYDRFVMEQLAGDALGADAATGFLVAGPYDQVKSPDINLTEMQRQDELADMINATGTALLGLTLGCARCHSHKFDPITQRDYYALQAVLAGVQHGQRQLPMPAEQQQQLAAVNQRIHHLGDQLRQLAPAAVAFRPPVQARRNVEWIRPLRATVVRLTVLETNRGEPCIDELEVWSGDSNLALAAHGGRATCSSSLHGYEIHKLEHVNDGLYGNRHSWISNEPGRGWVQIELAEPATIDRIEWGRDRQGEYDDRVATKYIIEAAPEPGQWLRVAASDDRLAADANSDAVRLQLEGLADDVAERGARLLGQLQQAIRHRERLSQVATAYAGTFQSPGPTFRLSRGDPLARREQVGPDTVRSLGSLELSADAPEQGRRLALARWIANRDNPLTARVLVNRLWQHHFGTGIVATPSDFGAAGARPTHPQLLDWLAGELIHSDWSLKHLQRMILLSSVFRQSSRARSAALAIDADARLLWRYPPRRLEAEAIRDSVLHVSGALDLQMSGPGFSGFEVQLENVRHYFPKELYGPPDWRRMIYMTKVRQEQDAVFGAFDCPDASQPAPRRSQSTTPLQALNLLNSHFMTQQSELLAQRVQREVGDGAQDQLRRAFQLCFGRDPDTEEMPHAVRLVADHDLAALCRALLNANEFLFVP